MDVPLSDATVGDAEIEAVMDVLESGHLKGGGPYWTRASELIEAAFDIEKAMLTTSCTHALEMAAILLNIDEGDEVIVPSYTFPSTATAFARQGAQIRFCEVKSDTLNMDPDHLEEIVGDETAAIVPVHYAGVGCDMDAISALASKYDAAVVEDAAQGVNATYDGRPLGSIGDIGAYSFHETKNYSAGEGGALLLNDDSFVERAEYVLHKGTSYAKFSRGEVDRYTWVDIGSSYVPSEMQAALAYTQLKRRDEIQEKRRRTHEYYLEALEPLANAGYLQLPSIPSGRESNYHIFYVLTRDSTVRDELMGHLRNRGIGAASHYEPLHTSSMGAKFGYEPSDLPRTKKLAGRLLRLPINARMDDEDRETVASEIRSFYRV